MNEIVEKLKATLQGSPWNLRERVEKLIKELEGTYLPKPLTRPQQNALHLGLKMVADALNLAGLDMRKVLKPEIEIPWTMQSAKDHLFRPIMKTMYSKESTTELSKLEEIDAVWDTMMRFLGQNHHLEYIEFPHDDRIAKLKT